MASGSSDLSTRMSAEDGNIENKCINDLALTYFKRYKVDISDAIKTTFPFLELLRDRDFITEEMYEKSQESLKKRSPVHEVIYDVLSELEKKFDMSLLGALFSKTIMKTYPDLFRIYKIFYKVIPVIKFLLKSDGGEEYEERPNERLSLEQGIGGNSNQRLMLLGPDTWNYNDTAAPECGFLEHRHDTQEINTTETGTNSENKDALKSQQANEQCAQQSKTAGAEILHHGIQTNSCSVDPVDIKEEKPFLNSGVECEVRAMTNCNQASDVIVIDSQDFEEFTGGDEPSKGSTLLLKRETEFMEFRKSPTSGKIVCETGEELLHHGTQTNSCSVDPVDIKEEKPFLNSGVECEFQAKTDCNQASDIIVIDSQDFEELTSGDGPPEASTTALKREPGEELLHHGTQTNSSSVDPVDVKEEKPFLNSGVKCEAQARTDCNQASDIIVIDSQDFEELTSGDEPPEASTTALKREPESMDFKKSPTSGKILCKTGEELLHHGTQTNSCSVDPVDIKEEKPFLNSGVECEAQARTDCNQASDIIVIDSQDFEELTSGDGPPEASTTALKREPGEELLHHGTHTNSSSVDPVDVKEEKPFLNSGVKCEAQARTDCNQASDIIVIDSQDFEELTSGDEPPEASTTALKREPESMDFKKSPTSGKILCKTGAEILHHGAQTNSCSVDPVDIKEEKPFLNSGVECEFQARTDCNQASDIIVINSQDFEEFTSGDGPAEASTTALKREPESIDFRKSPTSGKIVCKTGRSIEESSGLCAVKKPRVTCSSAVRNPEVSSGFSALNQPPGACSSAVRNPEVSSGFSAQNQPSGAYSSAVKVSEVSPGISAQNQPSGACSSAVRNPEESSEFSAQIQPQGPCSSAVRNPKVPPGISAQNQPSGACSSAVRVSELSSGFSAQNQPPRSSCSTVRNPEVSSGFSAQNQPPRASSSAVRNPEESSEFSAQIQPQGPCSSAVRNPKVSSGISAQKKLSGACSSAVRVSEVSSGFSAQNQPPRACSSAVRVLEVSSRISAQNQPSGACSSAVRVSEVSSGFSAQNQPPRACSSAVRVLEVSSGISAQNQPSGACSSAVRVSEVSSGFSAQNQPPRACSSAVRVLEVSAGISAQNQPSGACSSAVRNPEVSSGISAQNQPSGACSSAVRNPEESSEFSAQIQPQGPCSSAVRNPKVSSGISAQKKLSGACSSAVRVSEVSSGFSAQNQPPRACSSAVRVLEVSSRISAQNQPSGACSSAVRNPEVSSGISAQNQPSGACSSAVRVSEVSSGFSAQNQPPRACSSAVRVLEVSSGISAQNQPSGACSSAVRNPEVSSGISAQNQPSGACSSAVRVSEVSSGFSAQNQPPRACSSAVRVLEVSSRISAQNQPSGACSPAVRVSEVSSGFSAQNQPPRACSSAVRVLEVSAGISAQNQPSGACSSAVRVSEVSSGFSAQNQPPRACSSAVRVLEVSSGISAQNQPSGACSSAVRNPEVSSGISAQNQPSGACSSAVRNPEVSSGFSAQNQPQGPCGSAVRNPKVSSGISAQNQLPGACSSAVRVSEVSSGYSAQNQLPGASSSAVRVSEVSSGFSAQKTLPGACILAMRSSEVSSGFGALKKSSGPCSSAVRSLQGSSGFSARDNLLGACSSALRIGPDEKGTVHLGNKSTLEKSESKKRIREHMDVNVVFDAEILPVTCREMKGILIKRKFERGSMMKCIRSQDGNWFTLHEFELKGGYETCNWKNNVRCYEKTLKWLMEKKRLPKPPRTYGKIKKPENAEKCKICGDEGMLFKCSWCLCFFHGDCHIPPVDPKSKDWICTFCKIQVPSGNPQHASYAEIIARRMGPKEKSKCVFLLLKLYCHLEKNIFQNIPDEHYVQKASQCLETLRKLDEIKNKLNGGCFTKVNGLVVDMKKICQDSKHNDSVLTEEEFEKNFKEVFSIQ
ncbi:uncharacterized protein LOC118709344 [Pipistrellus kuhlii]|uniref:uncharacterized protein LOC118709344 n=1 Tax=Pipistrellus kuhlii TaxID=59472 RepID=UPI001E26F32F|nr:uncharacterized protein LOC118709344 [Pipistrellus kuhlii]